MNDRPRPAKLFVVLAFNRSEDGELRPAFEACGMQNEAAAVRFAKMIEDHHAGVIAWSRDVDLAIGEYGPPKVLYQSGDVPNMK